MPAAQKTRRKRFIDRLFKHYRLVVVNDDTLETEASLKLNLINLILLISSLFVLFAGIGLSLIVFTPLKERLPGFQDTYQQRQRLNEYKRITDSILHAASADSRYYNDLLAILNDSIPESGVIYGQVQSETIDELEVPGHDSMLRKEMRQKETYGILSGQQPRATRLLEEVNFFCPVKGPVVQAFDPGSGHYGIDIVASEGTPIKAALAGKVIQAGWSNTDGNFLVIQHHNDLATVYKHCAALMRRSGDAVTPGDVIAIIGNTGEFSHGLHLHLELWYNQSPVDPQNYISFK